MTAAEELQDSLRSFAASCNENARLMAMIADWNRTLHVRATDLGTDAALITQDGTVTLEDGAPPAADLVLQSTRRNSDADLLRRAFAQ